MDRKISLNGLTDKDESTLSALISLLPERKDGRWQVAEHGSVDVTVVDVDTQDGKLLADNLENDGRKVIRLTANQKASNEPWSNSCISAQQSFQELVVLPKFWEGNFHSQELLL